MTSAVLERIGISKYNAYQTMQVLHHLDLIDDDGNPKEGFERLRRASTTEYKAILAEMLRIAYAPIFTIADPAVDGEEAVTNAFKNIYEPAGQRERMVTLFLGLAAEAGIIDEADAPKSKRPSAARALLSTRKVQKDPPIPRAQQTRMLIEDELPKGQDSGAESFRPAEEQFTSYRLVFQQAMGLIEFLPKSGKWTKTKRDQWLSAWTDSITRTVDLLVEVQPED